MRSNRSSFSASAEFLPVFSRCHALQLFELPVKMRLCLISDAPAYIRDRKLRIRQKLLCPTYPYLRDVIPELHSRLIVEYPREMILAHTDVIRRLLQGKILSSVMLRHVCPGFSHDRGCICLLNLLENKR